MTDFLVSIGLWFRPYQYQTALAIIATLLVLFGNDINSIIKHVFRKHHIVIRTIVFVIVCAFGYGLLTVWLTAFLAEQLSKIPTLYIMPTVISIFITLGVYAQKQKHI